jgi:polar amino acid transport system permease protein
MDFSLAVVWHYLQEDFMHRAALTTIWLAVVSQTLGVTIGLIMALVGLSRNCVLRRFSQFYVWLFRGIPLLVQLFLLYFALPQVGLRLDPLQAGVTGLSLYEGALMSEIIRSGLIAVGRGQTEAAKSLGMSYLQSLRLVILPQAIRIILPPFGNNFNSMLRTTSLLSVISVEELLRMTGTAIYETFRPLELYSVAAIYYLAMTTTWNFTQERLERRLSVGMGNRYKQRRRGPRMLTQDRLPRPPA